MTEWYNNPDPMNVPNVTKAQAAIFTQGEDIDNSKPTQQKNIRAFTPMKKPGTLNRKHA